MIFYKYFVLYYILKVWSLLFLFLFLFFQEREEDWFCHRKEIEMSFTNSSLRGNLSDVSVNSGMILNNKRNVIDGVVSPLSWLWDWYWPWTWWSGFDLTMNYFIICLCIDIKFFYFFCKFENYHWERIVGSVNLGVI